MSRWLSRSLVASAALVVVPAAVCAQNIGGQPTYGSMTLSAGFMPDPQVRNVTAGGYDHTDLGGCNAAGMYIHGSAPDMNLYYTSGSLPLTIEGRSGSDVTLLVNTPDGRWHCDDDSGDGLNARLTFNSPQSGLYNVWVGTYSQQSGSLPSAQIYVSELGGGSNSNNSYNSNSGGRLNHALPATYGSVSLSSGFSPDPYSRSITAGGSVSVSSQLTGNGCRGYAASAPDLEVTYQAGSHFPLNIYADSNADVTLVVNGPDGSWYCSDDDGDGLNPLIRFNNPQSGTYDIWVGTYGSSMQQATVRVSELDPQW